MWVRDNEMIAKGDINRMREDAKGMYEGLKSWQYILLGRQYYRQTAPAR